MSQLRNGFFLALSAWGSIVFATPAQVIIIRHGEKLSDSNPHLSPRGIRRAHALVPFFLNNPIVESYGRPAAIFATEPHTDGSLRSIETVTPLASALGEPINHEYTKHQIPELVSAIMNEPRYNGKTVVIAWVHQQIPALAAQFGCTTAPQVWSSKVFDRAWVIRFEANQVQFANIPQHVLPGDTSQ